MVDDGGRGVHAAIHRAALHAVAREAGGFLVGALGNGNALHAHRVTGRVHHDEHVFKAAVLLSNDVTHCATVVAVLQHGRGRRLDAHLVLDAYTMHVIACAQRTVWVHHEFGHHKQANALHALGCAYHAGQHQVDDVVGHIVFTVGDVDLGTKNLIAAIGLGLGSAAHHGQIGASLWLSEVHGAGPLAAHQFFKVGGFQVIRTRREQGFNSAV